MYYMTLYTRSLSETLRSHTRNKKMIDKINLTVKMLSGPIKMRCIQYWYGYDCQYVRIRFYEGTAKVFESTTKNDLK